MGERFVGIVPPIDRKVLTQILVDKAKNAPNIMKADVAHPLAVRRGVALSGGGSHGDFEVGALQYLWRSYFAQVPPHIIGGTSVGSVNGALAAEGEVDSIERLVQLWLTTGLYEPVDIGAAFAPLTGLKDGLTALAAVSVALGPLGFLFGLPIVAAANQDVDRDVYEAVTSVKELFSLDPVRTAANKRERTWSAAGPGLRTGGAVLAPLPDGRTVVIARAIDRSLHARLIGGNGTWHSLSILGAEDPRVAVGANGHPWVVVRDVYGSVLTSKLVVDNDVPTLPDVFDVGATRPLGEGQREVTDPWMTGTAIAYEPRSETMYIAALTEPGVMWQCANTPTYRQWGSWATPTPLQQRIGSDVFVGKLGLAFAANGTGMFVGRRPDGTLVTARRGGNGGIVAPFTPFPGMQPTGQPTLVAVGHEFHLFYRGSNNSVIHATTRNGAWQPAASLGGVVLSDIAACALPDGGVVAVALGTDHAIWANECRANGAFGGWFSLGKAEPSGFAGTPVIGIDKAGTVNLVVVGNDRQLYHRPRPNGAWATWSSLGGRCFTGPKLRMAMVSLENGDTRHMNEHGVVEGYPTYVPPWPLTDGIIASSSIPIINKPVRIHNETYIDGGLASATPIAAVLEHCDEAIAILASAKSMESVDDTVVARFPDIVQALAGAIAPSPGIRELVSEQLLADGIGELGIVSPMGAPARQIDLANASVIDVGMRALSQIFPRSVMELEVAPPGGWSKPVTVIRPTMTLHSSSTMEWTQLSIEYGYMRAYDVMDAPDKNRAMLSSDRITMARLWCGKCEEALAADMYRHVHQTEGPKDKRTDTLHWQGSPPRSQAVALITAIRKLKALIGREVTARRAAGDVLPATADRWSTEWETMTPFGRSLAPTPNSGFRLVNKDTRVDPVTVPAA